MLKITGLVALSRSQVQHGLNKLLFRRQLTKRNVSFNNRTQPPKVATTSFSGDILLFSINRYEYLYNPLLTLPFRKRVLLLGTIASVMQMVFWGSMAGKWLNSRTDCSARDRERVTNLDLLFDRPLMAALWKLSNVEKSLVIHRSDCVGHIGNVHPKVRSA
jgi:hypothetical protein